MGLEQKPAAKRAQRLGQLIAGPAILFASDLAHRQGAKWIVTALSKLVHDWKLP